MPITTPLKSAFILKFPIPIRKLPKNYQPLVTTKLIRNPGRNYVNEPKFDDADLIAKGLNYTAYKPKRKIRPDSLASTTVPPPPPKANGLHKQAMTSQLGYLEQESERIAREVTLRRVKFIKYGSWVALLGIAVLSASSFLVSDSDGDDLLTKWFFSSSSSSNDKIERGKNQERKKEELVSLPVVNSDEFGFDTPGLYFVGEFEGKDEEVNCNSRRKDPWFGVPRRIPIFDKMLLRDVCLVDSKTNLVVDSNGDLFNWDREAAFTSITTTAGATTLTPVLSGEQIVQVKESNGCGYALTKAGEILIIPLDSLSSVESSFKHHEKVVPLLPRLWGWNERSSYRYKLDVSAVFDQKLGETKIESFDTGDRHLVLVSNCQRAFSCATGDPRTTHNLDVPASEDNNNDESSILNDQDISKGQFGVPALSHFHKYPEPNKLYEIELLNKWVSYNKSTAQSSSTTSSNTHPNVNFRKISKVVCGDYHTVALDTDGHLFTFGWNRYGQLGLAISYANEVVPYPKQLSMYGFLPFFNVGSKDDSSSGTMVEDSKNLKLKCVDVHACRETTYVTIQNELGEIKYFALGNGMFGELGNGTVKNSQFKPTQIRFAEGSMVKEWACNKDSKHVVCTLDGGVMESWGLNSHGQLANWKKKRSQKINKPTFVPQVLEPGIDYNKEGNKSLVSRDLVLNVEKQRVSVGKDGTCIYWVG